MLFIRLRLTIGLIVCGFNCILSQIPTGQIKGPFKWISQLYPGTERNYWLYIPAQYQSTKPTCTMIVQDGLSRARGWKLSEHLDTLIHEGKIPPVIGIYIDHGRVLSKDTTDFPRFNRSFEYDGLGDRYARFLIEEVIPEVKKSYNLSDDPNDRCIAGASSGAICAFNAAWERPDAFRRVFSTIGTYVGLCGADEFHTLVRKTEPKPLRVFLEDGFNDLNIYAGDWYIANQQMNSALTWAGYEVDHAWGEGGHNNEHSLKIIRDALIWLWKDYPVPVSTHLDKYRGMSIIKNQEGWREIKTNVPYIDRIAVNSKGEIYFISRDKNGVYKLNDDGSGTITAHIKYYSEIAFDVNDNMVLANKNSTGISITKGSAISIVLPKTHSDKIETTQDGFYFNDTRKNRFGYYHIATDKVHYFPSLKKIHGIALNAEQSFVNVMEEDAVFGSSYKVNADGTLEHPQSYIHFHIPYGYSNPEARSAVIDTANILYTATNMGVQVSDQLGRVNMILPAPNKFVSDICFGGKDFNELYIISNGKLYARKVNTKGKLATVKATRPPRPGM